MGVVTGAGTGAGSGVGEAIAKALSKHGMEIAQLSSMRVTPV